MDTAARAAVPPRRRWRRLIGRVTWGLYLFVEVPLVVLAVAALAAPRLHPGPFWWAQLLAAGLPYVALAFGAALAGPILWKRWGWVLVHGALLAAMVWRVWPGGPAEGAPSAGADDLVLLTFNVPQTGPSREALQDSVAALVRTERPHIVGLQESVVAAPRPQEPGSQAPQVEAITEALPYTLAVPAGLIDRGSDGRRRTSVPLLVRADGPARVEVLEQVAVRLGDLNDRGASMATRTLFRWRGREAVHYNVHLRSYGREKPWEEDVRVLEPSTWLPFARRYRRAYGERAREVDVLAAAIGRETAPVLVSGDFNEAPYGWAYHRLRAGLIDAFQSAGRGDGRTYHARRPLVRIDYVLADSAWEVTAAEVEPVRFSDHRPLIVRLRWRDTPVQAGGR